MERLQEPVYILNDSFFVDAYQQIKDVRHLLTVKHNETRYPVYNQYLWVFLKTEKVALHVDFHESNKTIDGTLFVKSYAEGFEAGEKAFKERFPTDPKQLYGEHADAIVNEMHKALCHDPNRIFEGCGWIASVNNQQPREIRYSIVGWYGYFGGLLKSYDIIESNNEILFKKLIKCEHRLISAPAGTTSNNNSSKSTNEKIKLVDWFEHTSKYKIIMDLLVNKGYCETETYIWTYNGPGKKGLIVRLIKLLHAQGFYKKNMLPTNSEIIVIAENTFNVDIGIDTAKREKAVKDEFPSIKPASTYPE